MRGLGWLAGAWLVVAASALGVQAQAAPDKAPTRVPHHPAPASQPNPRMFLPYALWRWSRRSGLLYQLPADLSA